MARRPVAVRILHPEPGPLAGPLERWVGAARAGLAERHRRALLAAGADDVAIRGGPPDDTPFGARLRAIVRADRPEGLVILGSGAIPLATRRDYRDLAVAAGSDERVAVANNRFSADVVAVSRADALADLPDLPSDNALPRWLEEVAGYSVRDLRRRWRLGMDIDGPLELVILGAHPPDGIDAARVQTALSTLRTVAADRRAEMTVAGRLSTGTLAWLERGIPARVRAVVEERGLRAASLLAQAEHANVQAPGATPRATRPPASLLGMLIDRDGPGSLGAILARLGEAAVVDTRVLLAHRLGTDETAWPSAEDRFASDLLLTENVRDPWLRDLTAAAVAAPIPIVLGGHSLVGPGARLILSGARTRQTQWT